MEQKILNILLELKNIDTQSIYKDFAINDITNLLADILKEGGNYEK